jgi:hypothetical protein
MTSTESQNLDHRYLKEILHYDPETGIFQWLVKKSRRTSIGSVAGTITHGYLSIKIDGKIYLNHRLAWLYVHSTWPQYEIDHIDGDKLNNRLENLRDATHKQNTENQKLLPSNKSGHRGVSWSQKGKKWRAYLKNNGKTIHLGYYEKLEDAALAAREAREKIFTHDHGRDLSVK